MRKKQNFLLKAVSLCCALLMLCGLLGACTSSKCDHNFVNGVCIVCDYKCEHKEYKNGKCTECAIKCKHENYENGVCVTCKTACDHNFSHGVCVICDYECTHETYENGLCTVCYTKCTHAVYDNGVCVECNYVCPHTNYVNGVCQTCHINCNHKFVNSVCTNCKMLCNHNYVNGVCEICKATEYVEPPKTDGNYTYVPHISSELPRIDVTSATFMSDATRNVTYFDNSNPANNIDWQYHDCTVSVSNCEGYELTDVVAGIKIRGNWTTTYPKKPFRIKFDKKQGMLGLNDGEKFKSWVLLADYKDISLERNSVAFYLGNQILGSDGYYTSDFRQVELYLNGQYWGVYLLAEQQQVNKNRVNINEPEDGYTGTDIGYFIEYDGYYNLEVYNERFSCDYMSLGGSLKTRDGYWHNPDQIGFAIKNDIYDVAQKQFIKSYIGNLYKLSYEAVYNHKYYAFNSNYTGLVSYTPKTGNPVLETVSKVIDIQSLVDIYILSEIACDYDLYWSSFLMDVDMSASGDKILKFEAPWDFDSAFGLRDACSSGTGLYAANTNNPWILLFINEDWYWNKVKEKWQEMKAANVQANTLKFVNDLKSNFSNAAYKRNFDKWGFVKSGEIVWPANESKNQGEAATYLYNWLNTRFSYLDSVWL